MQPQQEQPHVVVVGGGVAGVTAALRVRSELPEAHVRLISDTPYFEYHGALYRVAAGGAPEQARIPLREIFASTDVDIIEDTVTGIDADTRQLIGASGSTYGYDYVLLALGVQAEYYGIKGLAEHAHQARTVNHAVALHRHLDTVVERVCQDGADEQKLQAGYVVIVGAGATGTELAGELSEYLRGECDRQGTNASYVTVELVEAAPRVMPKLPDAFSVRIEQRLRDLQVNVLTNREVTEVRDGVVCLEGMEIEASTVVWCAGVRANDFYRNTDVFTTNESGAVVVDAALRADGHERIFVAGDAAVTPHAGYAQTAISHGTHVATAIARQVRGKTSPRHRTRAPLDVIPVGRGWAGAFLGRFNLYGRVGWWLRRAIDLKVYLTFLPLSKAIRVFRSGWRE